MQPEDLQNTSPQSEYFLEEFGKLKLNYFPEKVGVFSGALGVSYVLMTMGTELVVFVIQAIFKHKKGQHLINAGRSANIQIPGLPSSQPQAANMQHLLSNSVQYQPNYTDSKNDVEGQDIENFKMARRCTIPLPYSKPRLVESYVDYFIVGAYEDKPYQVDIFDRSKINIKCIDVARELKIALQKHAVPSGKIVSLDHILVPRLKWSDRQTETFEQRRRVQVSMSGQPNKKDGHTTMPHTKTICGLRRLLFIGNVQIGHGSQPQAFILSYNVMEQRHDKLKLPMQVQDASQITAVAYGPYDNGHLILGLESGHLLAYEVNTAAFELVFHMQICSYPLTAITFDPTHLILVSCEVTKRVYAVSIIDKKYEYVYLDLGVNQYATIPLDHEKNKEAILNKARAKRIDREQELFNHLPCQSSSPQATNKLYSSVRSQGSVVSKNGRTRSTNIDLAKTPKMDFRRKDNLRDSIFTQQDRAGRATWATSSQQMPDATFVSNPIQRARSPPTYLQSMRQ